jgi:hypothetical protein
MIEDERDHDGAEREAHGTECEGVPPLALQALLEAGENDARERKAEHGERDHEERVVVQQLGRDDAVDEDLQDQGCPCCEKRDHTSAGVAATIAGFNLGHKSALGRRRADRCPFYDREPGGFAPAAVRNERAASSCRPVSIRPRAGATLDVHPSSSTGTTVTSRTGADRFGSGGEGPTRSGTRRTPR